MKKIRINELARELEVKPGIILDLLPELGVQEKKTHSSSIEEDTALALRERLAESGILGSFPNRANGHHEGDEGESSTDASQDGPANSEAAAPAFSPAPAQAASSPEPIRPVLASAPAAAASLAPPARFPLRPPARDAQTHTETAPRGITIPPPSAPGAPAGSQGPGENAASPPAAPAPEPE